MLGFRGFNRRQTRRANTHGHVDDDISAVGLGSRWPNRRCQNRDPAKKHVVDECVVVAARSAFAFAEDSEPYGVVRVGIARRACVAVRQFASGDDSSDSLSPGNRMRGFTGRKS